MADVTVKQGDDMDSLGEGRFVRCRAELGVTSFGFSILNLPPHDENYPAHTVLLERERYHELRLRALKALCDRELRAGRLPQAVAAGLEAVRAEPLRDSARRALIRAHLAEGNNAEALA